MMKNLFQNSEIIEKQNYGQNIDSNLVADEYIVFFDNDCLAKNDYTLNDSYKNMIAINLMVQYKMNFLLLIIGLL